MSRHSLTGVERQRFVTARERGRQDAAAANAVEEARYNPSSDAVELLFRSGATATIPREQIGELRGAREADLRTVNVSPAGDAVSWRSLDLDINVRGLLKRVFLAR